jgi:hypothetical protein
VQSDTKLVSKPPPPKGRWALAVNKCPPTTKIKNLLTNENPSAIIKPRGEGNLGNKPKQDKKEG